MLLLLSFACASLSTSPCADWPSDPVEADGVLENADSCGFWLLPVGEHLYVNVGITAEESTCAATMEPYVELNADPIYSNMSNEGPKWTFDFVGMKPSGAEATGIDVSCDEGTEWAARVVVE